MVLIRLGLRPWRETFFGQVAGSMVLGLILFCASMLMWFEGSARQSVARMRGESLVLAYLNTETSAEEDKRTFEALKKSLGKEAQSIEYMDTQRTLEAISKSNPEIAREIEGMGADAQSVIPKHIRIKGDLTPAEWQAHLDRITVSQSGITRVEFSKNRNLHILGAFESLAWILRALTAGMAIVFVIVALQVSRSQKNQISESIELLRLWGASRWATTMPYLASHFIMALIAAATSFSLWIWASQGVMAKIIANTKGVMASAPFTYWIVPTVVGAIVAMTLGHGVSWLGFRKGLRAS